MEVIIDKLLIFIAGGMVGYAYGRFKESKENYNFEVEESTSEGNSNEDQTSGEKKNTNNDDSNLVTKEELDELFVNTIKSKKESIFLTGNGYAKFSQLNELPLKDLPPYHYKNLYE